MCVYVITNMGNTQPNKITCGNYAIEYFDDYFIVTTPSKKSCHCLQNDINHIKREVEKAIDDHLNEPTCDNKMKEIYLMDKEHLIAAIEKKKSNQ